MRLPAIALTLLAASACGGPSLQIREVRTGVQHDSAGRSFVENRHMTATLCIEPGRPPVSEHDVRARLAITAQEQGYSGVAGIACVNHAPAPCMSGFTCGGIAVRYLEGSGASSGTSCDPPCEGTSRCEEGVCVPTCEPPCVASEVCVQGARCQPAPP